MVSVVLLSKALSLTLKTKTSVKNAYFYFVSIDIYMYVCMYVYMYAHCVHAVTTEARSTWSLPHTRVADSCEPN